MKEYVRIDSGFVVEIIEPKLYDDEAPGWIEGDESRVGQEIPIEKRFTQELIQSFVESTAVSPKPQLGWSYADGKFKAPSTTPIPETIGQLNSKLSAIDLGSIELIRKFVLGISTEADGITLSTKQEEYALIKTQLSEL